MALLLAALPSMAAAQAGALRAGDVALHYWPGHERLARSLLPDDAALVLPGLPPDLLRRGDTVQVYLAPDVARWDSLTGGRAPDWGAGIAIPALATVVLPGYMSDRGSVQALPQIMRHELAHIALHRYLGGALIPRWFNEGYAMWSAGQFDADAGWQLRLAFLSRRAPPLDSIALDWPLLEADARLAYLLSGSAVRYLYSLGPPDAFQRMLSTWRDTGSFERALRDVYIVSTPQFERLWRSHVRRQFGWLQILAQSAFIWLVVTLAVVVLFMIRRRRDRLRLEALRAAEEPDRPAYWLETPDDDGTAYDAATPDGPAADPESGEPDGAPAPPRGPGPGAPTA